jgi:hypothetical protein
MQSLIITRTQSTFTESLSRSIYHLGPWRSADALQEVPVRVFALANDSVQSGAGSKTYDPEMSGIAPALRHQGCR